MLLSSYMTDKRQPKTPPDSASVFQYSACRGG